jgi:hypothetical protein
MLQFRTLLPSSQAGEGGKWRTAALVQSQGSIDAVHALVTPCSAAGRGGNNSIRRGKNALFMTNCVNGVNGHLCKDKCRRKRLRQMFVRIFCRVQLFISFKRTFASSTVLRHSSLIVGLSVAGATLKCVSQPSTCCPSKLLGERWRKRTPLGPLARSAN